MNDHTRFSSDGGRVEIVLEGGPSDLITPTEVERRALVERKLKIQHRNGYEHFELVDDAGDAGPVTLRWTMHTKIAE